MACATSAALLGYPRSVGGGWLSLVTSMPPPQPPTGPGAMPSPVPGGPVAFDPVESLRYAWAGFTKNAGPFLLLALLAILVTFGFSLAGGMIDGRFDAISSSDGRVTGAEASLFGMGTIVQILGSAVATIFSLGMLRMAFDVVDGRKADLGRMLTGYNVGVGIVVAFLVGLLTGIGIVLCVLPGIVVGVLMIFSSAQVVDAGSGVGEAISGSARLVMNNLGAVIIWALLLLLIAVLSFCTCGLAFFVTWPLFTISTAYAFRTLRHQPVAQPV